MLLSLSRKTQQLSNQEIAVWVYHLIWVLRTLTVPLYPEPTLYSPSLQSKYRKEPSVCKRQRSSSSMTTSLSTHLFIRAARLMPFPNQSWIWIFPTSTACTLRCSAFSMVGTCWDLKDEDHAKRLKDHYGVMQSKGLDFVTCTRWDLLLNSL